MSAIAEETLIVAFTGFTRFTHQIDQLPDLEVARVMEDYYALASRVVEGAGGRVVKFIGDAMLAVFPEHDGDRAMLALLELKTSADAFMEAQGWDCRLVVKVHGGPVAAGDYRVGDGRRYDVLGKTVNVTVRLESSGFALSAEAFRRLGPQVRQRFKKHTPPVTYIRIDDAHRPRWAKS